MERFRKPSRINPPLGFSDTMPWFYLLRAAAFGHIISTGHFLPIGMLRSWANAQYLESNTFLAGSHFSWQALHQLASFADSSLATLLISWTLLLAQTMRSRSQATCNALQFSKQKGALLLQEFTSWKPQRSANKKVLASWFCLRVSINSSKRRSDIMLGHSFSWIWQWNDVILFMPNNFNVIVKEKWTTLFYTGPPSFTSFTALRCSNQSAPRFDFPPFCEPAFLGPPHVGRRTVMGTWGG